MLGRAALIAAALLDSPAASAQGMPSQADKPLDEIAADMAYGFCPRLLGGLLSVESNAEVTGYGFGKDVLKQQHPTRGEFKTVKLDRPEGRVVFGGAAGQACQVVVSGGSEAATLKRLRESMSFMGLPFELVPNPTAVPAGMTAETFKAKVDAQTLYVQLIQQAGPPASVIAQLYVTEE